MTHRDVFLREQLSEAQNHRCAYCGKPFNNWKRRCTLDHLQARAHGGRATYENAVAACLKCNQERGVQNPTKFWLSKNPQARGIQI